MSLECGGICNDHFVANCVLSLAVNEFLKSLNISWSRVTEDRKKTWVGCRFLTHIAESNSQWKSWYFTNNWYISTHKSYIQIKYLHCVPSTDVSWVGHAFQSTLNSVYMSTALHQCEHDASVHLLSQTSSHSKNHYGLVLWCTRRLWIFQYLDCLKRLWHSEHLYGLCPVWTLMWLFRVSDSLNALSHIWHLCGLSSVWTRSLCIFKLLDWLKLLSHSEHLYGLSPVWTLMCLFRSPDWVNALSHMWHLYGLSPVWTLMWVSRCWDWVNALSHMWHLCGFSPLWILLCVTRLSARVNRLLQTLHSNGFSPEWIRQCLARSLLLWQHLSHSVHLYLPVWIFLWWLSAFCDEKHFSHWVHEYCPVFMWAISLILEFIPAHTQSDIDIYCSTNYTKTVKHYQMIRCKS